MKLRFYTEERVVILEDSNDYEIINFAVDRETSFFYQLKGSNSWNEIIIKFNDEKEVFEIGSVEYSDRQQSTFCGDSAFYRFFTIPFNDIYIQED